jgi:glycosyltransferase involved in cell wall biosynthesis
MHQKDHSLLERMNIQTEAVVINQCDREGEETVECNGNRVLWVNTTERGLSRSRNMALRHADADVCLIADDDEILRDGYAELITDAFDKNPDFSMIRFAICGIEKPFRHYETEEFNIGYLKSMKMSSVEIAFKLADVKDNGIWFDEKIGSGTQFLMGEENAFIFASLRSKLKARFVPSVIADLHIGDSTWFKGYNEAYLIGKGAAFTAMKTPFTWLLIWQFAVRKYKKYSKNVSLVKAVRLMNEGKKRYLKG